MKSAYRLIWLDNLRVLAGISMIGLHATSDSMGGAWADAAISERVGPTIIRTLLYVARTELFIIISAFLLVMSLDRRPRGYTNVVKDQFVRLSIPFGFWTLFYAVYGLVKATHLGYSDLSLIHI